MAVLGCLDKYCSEIGNISYLDHVEWFFIANDIAHDTQIKCKAISISIINEKEKN